MPLKIAIQMDDPRNIVVTKDSSFIFGLEAQKRGYDLHYYNTDTLRLKNGEVSASCATMTFRRSLNDHVTLGAFKDTDLKSFDIILMRNDFNDVPSYIAMTHILDHLAKDVLVVNNPTGVRESPEKMLITHFPDLAPPTLISRNLVDIRAFHAEHKELILKPLNGFGGAGIYHITEGDDNLSSIYEMLCALYTEPFVVQKYLPEIAKGDKRIIVVEGEPIGAFNRLPASGNARANLAAGGRAAKAEITPRDVDICARLKPELIKRGLSYVGLDVIGDYVTEINPKSPTGLQQIFALSGIKCEETIWDAFETRYKEFKSK
ncbi:MAG: glutathione synthase [Alphaproteobacteria bacterium]